MGETKQTSKVKVKAKPTVRARGPEDGAVIVRPLTKEERAARATTSPAPSTSARAKASATRPRRGPRERHDVDEHDLASWIFEALPDNATDACTVAEIAQAVVRKARRAKRTAPNRRTIERFLEAKRRTADEVAYAVDHPILFLECGRVKRYYVDPADRPLRPAHLGVVLERLLHEAQRLFPPALVANIRSAIDDLRGRDEQGGDVDDAFGGEDQWRPAAIDRDDERLREEWKAMARTAEAFREALLDRSCVRFTYARLPPDAPLEVEVEPAGLVTEGMHTTLLAFRVGAEGPEPEAFRAARVLGELKSTHRPASARALHFDVRAHLAARRRCDAEARPLVEVVFRAATANAAEHFLDHPIAPGQRIEALGACEYLVKAALVDTPEARRRLLAYTPFGAIVEPAWLVGLGAGTLDAAEPHRVPLDRVRALGTVGVVRITVSLGQGRTVLESTAGDWRFSREEGARLTHLVGASGFANGEAILRGIYRIESRQLLDGGGSAGRWRFVLTEVRDHGAPAWRDAILDGFRFGPYPTAVLEPIGEDEG